MTLSEFNRKEPIARSFLNNNMLLKKFNYGFNLLFCQLGSARGINYAINIINARKHMSAFNRTIASYGICLLLVHHTRKQQSDDKFDMISGTNGLLGAADGAFLLTKEKRTGNAACLDVSGRDQPDQRLHLFRNEETLAWELERVETELWKAPPEPLLEQVSAFLSSVGKRTFRKRKSNGKLKGNRPNAVGTEDEQYPEPCNGNCEY